LENLKMKTYLLAGAVAAVLVAISGTAIATPCYEGNHDCPFNDERISLSLVEVGDSLTLTTTVQGCAGMRAMHHDEMLKKAEEAGKGKVGCERSPFGVKGLKYQVEKTGLGTLITITGPADKRARFKTRFDAEMEQRKGGKGHKVCGCDKSREKEKEKGCGCGK